MKLSFIFFVLLAAALAAEGPLEQRDTRSSNIEVQGLVPFPRIGRTAFENSLHTYSNQVSLARPCMHSNYLQDYLNLPCSPDEVSQPKERRGEKKPQTYKIVRRLVGLWFGPRLGKKSESESEMDFAREDLPRIQVTGAKPRSGRGSFRNPVIGLIPFARPGRSKGSSQSDGLKRHITGLIPHGRTGRSGAKGPKRNGASPGGGMWFGPRLGKRDPEFLAPVIFQDGDSRDFSLVDPTWDDSVNRALNDGLDNDAY